MGDYYMGAFLCFHIMMDIVEELRRDRESGAKRLETEYKAGLMTLARRFCNDEGDAEELVNRTFAEVINGIDDYLEQSAFFAWMCQILVNLRKRDNKRKSNKTVVYPGVVPEMVDDDAQEAIYRNLDYSLLRDALAEMPTEMRELLLLHYFMEIPIPKLAKILAVPAGTVKSRLHYARSVLAAKMGVAVKKPGGKAVLLALLLCGLTALGAAVWNLAASGEAQNQADTGMSLVESRVSSPTPAEDAGQATSTARQADACAATPSATSQQTEASNLSTFQPFNFSTDNPQGDTMNISKTSRTAAMLAAATVATSAATAANAADYYLPAGETDTISTNVAYATMSVNGDLTVQDGAVITIPTVSMTGGSLTVTGGGTSFGENHSSYDTKTTYTLNPDGSGVYPRLSATSSGTLKIYSATVASGGSGTDGVFDVLRIEDSKVYARWLYNNSSTTGCVAFAGSSATLERGPAMGWDGIFKSGAWLISLENGVSAKIDVQNQQGRFNSDGVYVRTTGSGDLSLLSGSSEGMYIYSGAVFDHTGSIAFSRSSGTASKFFVKPGVVFGPNVTNVVASANAISLTIESGAEMNVGDFDFSMTGGTVTGGGRIVVDASVVRSFKAGIPADGTITLEKTGAAELAVSSTTNIPSLIVGGGTVRCMSDCAIGALSGAAGTTLIADGCSVALPAGDSVFGGLSLETANGGSFVNRVSGRSTIYEPGALEGMLHVANGDLVFSAYGLTQKYWRWTFTKTATSPNPLWLGRLWLFGADGSHAAAGLTRATDNASTLSAGQVCYRYDSATTNLESDASAPEYEKSYNLNKVFNDSLVSGMNNFPMLASPVIDPGNETSWLGIEFQLRASDKPVTGYNIMSAAPNSPNFATVFAHSPVSWKVEASDDGATWTELEMRTDVDMTKVTAKGMFYDGETSSSAALRGSPVEHFKFSGYKRDGLAADATKRVTLQIDGGASIDLTAFTASQQTIDGIVIDLVQGGGTILGGAIAKGGVLTIRNTSQGFAIGSPLPISLIGISEADDLSNWTIVADGAVVRGRLKIVSNGSLVVQPLFTVMVFR